MQSPPLETEPDQEKQASFAGESSPANVAHEVLNVVGAMSQKQFCTYLNESAANVSAKAARRGLSIEDYLKTIAIERRGENWERELGVKGRWVKQT